MGKVADTRLQNNFDMYMKSSLSKNTWASYTSGWNSFKNFQSYVKQNCNWPIETEVARAYVTWCLSVQKLKPATVKLYLASLKVAHHIQGHSCTDFLKDHVIDMLLRGADNVQPMPQRIRKAMTLDLLLILGHKIAEQNWSKISKQVIWAACTFSFFTSVRLGEILSGHKGNFDRSSTLTWGNVLFQKEGEILIFVPTTKTSGKGDFIDLFPLTGHTCCPVAALKKLEQLQKTEKMHCKEMPVFTFASGTYLTTNSLNGLLKELFAGTGIEGTDSISCHSFRAALASAICSWPDRFVVNELQEWSRWRGSSYTAYCRSYREQRRKLFEKIVTILK
jgi:integrase